MKYAVVTFGCRVNQADSLAIEGRLRAHGATDAPAEHADLVIVNSCSVTAAADQGTRQTIRRIVRNNPGVKVVVTGCYATRRPDEVRSLPNVIAVVSNDDKDSVDRYVPLLRVDAASAERTTAQRFTGGDGACGDALAPGVAGRTAFTLRVQTGCEERCSYCIIPSTRGAGRSLPPGDVQSAIRRAIEAGYKEIVITGVHLGSYGRDLPDGVSLTTLVRMLARWSDEVLFRLSSLEPMDCTPEIVAEVTSSPRLAPHFHLPLQHGSDEMLRAMRRPYTAAYYASLVRSIREALPHAAVGSDIIVGFPGESARQFDDLCVILEKLPLTHLHVFPYSDRPGTQAADLEPKVDGAVIRERGRVVRAIGERMAREFKHSQVGRSARALTVDDGWSVVTDNYLKLRLNEQRPRNEWVRVRVDGGQRASLLAGADLREM